MRKQTWLFLFTSLLLTPACAFLNGPLQEIPSPTPAFEAQTPLKPAATLAEENKCDGEKWRIALTSVNEIDTADGAKMVIATLGIENNGSLWGQVKGPDDDWLDLGTEPSSYITTKDGSTYGYIWGAVPTSSDPSFPQEDTGWISTHLLPPGFSSLGVIHGGTPYYYKLGFPMPTAQIPDTLTIGGMLVLCIEPHMVDPDGTFSYSTSSVDLPIKTYDMSTEITRVHPHPPAAGYPDLVGSKLDLPNGEGTIEFTQVMRDGDTVRITFSFTNLSADDASVPFNGYLIGDSGLSTCQERMRTLCEFSDYSSVPAGQTQTLTWLFEIPENETNLLFVYVYGDEIDVNKVYSINPN